MVRAAIGFFVIALVAYFLGAGGVGGLSMEIGRMLLIAFLILAAVSFVGSLITGRNSTKLP
jgi:uncharacterized membrane protein YtjA (UPF0391 family)